MARGGISGGSGGSGEWSTKQNKAPAKNRQRKLSAVENQ
jgi:hypothetical protein